MSPLSLQKQAKMSVSTPIHTCFGIPSQSSNTRKINKVSRIGKDKTKIIFIPHNMIMFVYNLKIFSNYHSYFMLILGNIF